MHISTALLHFLLAYVICSDWDRYKVSVCNWKVNPVFEYIWFVSELSEVYVLVRYFHLWLWNFFLCVFLLVLGSAPLFRFLLAQSLNQWVCTVTHVGWSHQWHEASWMFLAFQFSPVWILVWTIVMIMKQLYRKTWPRLWWATRRW